MTIWLNISNIWQNYLKASNFEETLGPGEYDDDFMMVSWWLVDTESMT